MPTKMNRSEQQPYVPKGDDNGGEYRSYGFGGQAVPKGAYKKIKPKGIKVEPSEETKSSFDKYLEEKHKGSEFGKRLKEDFEQGQKEGKTLLDKAMQQKGISYSQSKNGQDYFSPLEDVVLSNRGAKSKSYTKGGTFYHESYHALDYAYGGVSSTYVTSNGKTLKEMLIGRQKPPIKERLEKAREEETAYRQEWLKTHFEDYEDLQNKREEIRKERDEIYSKTEDKTNRWSISRKHREKEYDEILDKIFEIESSYYQERHKVWGDVSDMFCMQGYGYVFGMGHSSSYAKDTSRRCREFFAECGSAENTNPQSLELIKKYFPEQYQAYRECIEHIKEKQKNEPNN